MVKTTIGMVTFGNLPFTQLAIREILATTKSPIEICVIVGQPGDTETLEWLRTQVANGVIWIDHEENKGFPASVNDLYDWAWQSTPFDEESDHLIVIGNDVVPYPGAIDALIECAETTDFEWVCASQYDSRALLRDHPAAAVHFHGEALEFRNFGARPWELHEVPREHCIQPDSMSDVRNLCLFKRGVFEKIGYADAGFWPGGYFEDNDYCTRARLAGVRSCTLRHASYFHFWSRTMHQGGRAGNFHHRTFCACEQFYRTKWGGRFGEEQWTRPFDGRSHLLAQNLDRNGDPLLLEGSVKIGSRWKEPAIIEHWRAESEKP